MFSIGKSVLDYQNENKTNKTQSSNNEKYLQSLSRKLNIYMQALHKSVNNTFRHP